MDLYFGGWCTGVYRRICRRLFRKSIRSYFFGASPKRGSISGERSKFFTKNWDGGSCHPYSNHRNLFGFNRENFNRSGYKLNWCSCASSRRLLRGHDGTQLSSLPFYWVGICYRDSFLYFPFCIAESKSYACTNLGLRGRLSPSNGNNRYRFFTFNYH